MKNNVLKKSIALLMLLILFISSIYNIVLAKDIGDEAYLQNNGDCGFHLQYWKEEKGIWSYIICTYVTYNENGNEYPAYCLNRESHGVGETGDYSVDLTNLLDDVRIWRTIINAYPYKSPEEMNVENEFDAFVATKQAVYCILYDWDPETRFRGADERGERIANAIVNLVNIGRNGTQTPYTNGISISKVGDFIEDGNYYTQEFKTDCGINTKNYTITATNGLPYGTIITDMNNNETTTFNGTSNFKVKIPKTSINSDINAIFSLQACAKNYPVFFGKTRIDGTQNYAITADPFGNITGIGNFNLSTNTGKIQINKTDTDTKEPISGVTFQLSKTDGTIIGNATTNEKGIATFSKLYPGNYILKEINTPENYVVTDINFEVNVTFNKTTIKNISNEHKKGNLKIYKVDKDNHKIKLMGVVFDLFSKELNKVIGTYTTDSNGEIDLSNLRIGDYTLIEKETGKLYNLGKDTDIKIEWNKETPITIENEAKKGQIKVIKVDKDNNEIKLEGVEFEVLDKDNNILEKIITDSNGEALTQKYALKDYDTLKIRESKTLTTYDLSTEIQTIKLEENQIKSITFTNEKKKGQIKVIKVDADNKEIKIPNVEFKVYDKNENIVDTLVTDTNGEATTKKLPIDQDYKIKETKTNEWYVLNNDIKTITLKQNQISTITFTNEKKKGQIKVIKIDEDNNEIKLEGVVFDVLDSNNNIVDTITTNSNGEAITKKLPIDQNYKIIEKQTQKEYVLSTETPVVTLKENEITSLTFTNRKIKGYLEITKVDLEDKNKKLEGATFAIYNDSGLEIEKIKTDKYGKATSSLLPYGKYFLKELDSGSVYYLLNENTFNFEIKQDGEIVPITIKDEHTDVKVDVDKKGSIEVQPNDNVNYEFSNIANNSNIYLEKFKWFDYIPTEYVKLQSMTTGKWNQNLTYKVYYKTNKSQDYILFKENMSTQENYYLDFNQINLTEDEYIIEIMFDFGKVEKGFKETISPTMSCKSFENLEDGQTFTNHTKTFGSYFDMSAECTSKWTTIVHKPVEKHENILPRTGK